jgi:hypothetical protein
MHKTRKDEQTFAISVGCDLQIINCDFSKKENNIKSPLTIPKC